MPWDTVVQHWASQLAFQTAVEFDLLNAQVLLVNVEEKLKCVPVHKAFANTKVVK